MDGIWDLKKLANVVEDSTDTRHGRTEWQSNLLDSALKVINSIMGIYEGVSLLR